MSDDLYCNSSTDPDLYLRVTGVYYRRAVDNSWQVIDEREAPALAKFSPIHPKQWNVFVDDLIEQGLLTGDEWWLLFRPSR